MKRILSIITISILLSGCNEKDVRDFWIYEQKLRERNKKIECDKPCCHVYFNKYCEYCKEERQR